MKLSSLNTILADTSSYFCFTRKYLALDQVIAVWRQMAGGKCEFVLALDSRTRPFKIKECQSIPEGKYNQLISVLVENGAPSLESQDERLIICDFDDHFSYKSQDGVKNEFYILGSEAMDERVTEVTDYLYKEYPLLDKTLSQIALDVDVY